MEQQSCATRSQQAVLTIVGNIHAIGNGKGGLPCPPAKLTHGLAHDFVVWESLVGPSYDCSLHPLTHAALRRIGRVKRVVASILPWVRQEVGYEASLGKYNH